MIVLNVGDTKMAIYLLGCMIAALMLYDDYLDDYPEVCDNTESGIIFFIGIMGSWITVLLMLWKKYS